MTVIKTNKILNTKNTKIMAIIKAQVKKQYALETIPMLRMLASGIKLTDAVMSPMKLKAGIAQEKDDKGKVVVEGEPGDHIHFATDNETGKVYLYKANDGAVIGATKTFTNSGLRAELVKMATGAEIKDEAGKTVATFNPGTEIKGGLQIRYDVSTTPVDGEYFEVTFKDAILVKDEAKAESNATEKAAKTEAKPKAKAAKAESDWK